MVCGNNNISSLNVDNNTALKFLTCYGNNLSSLNVDNNTALEYLDCDGNNLSSLNVRNGNNTIISFFKTPNNPNLTCIQVDDAAWSVANWTSIDPWSTFSEDCKSFLGLDDELLTQAITFFPNPVTDILTIDSEIPLTKVEVYSVLGKRVKEIKSNFESIPTQELSNGVYVVRIYSENGIAAKKLIKK